MDGLHRRPLVVVEDHLYHIDLLLDLLRRHDPSLAARLTVVCLDRAGPDTQAAVARWGQQHPAVQVIADAEPAHPQHHRALPPAALEHAHAYARTVAELLAPRGLLVQDIQLQTLRFVSADQWWETIYLANTVRGMFAERPPQCVFLSNKRGFHATFGKDLLSVGFDPRDVLHKDELPQALVPLLRRRLHDAFPLELHATDDAEPEWITRDPEELPRLSARLDLVLWDDRAAKPALSGRALAARGSERLELPAHGHEALTWRALVDARLHGRPGVPTRLVGERVAPELALPAEQSNAAAKHVYALRRRLHVPDGIATIDHCYALAPELAVGWVRPRARTSTTGE